MVKDPCQVYGNAKPSLSRLALGRMYCTVGQLQVLSGRLCQSIVTYWTQVIALLSQLLSVPVALMLSFI